MKPINKFLTLIVIIFGLFGSTFGIYKYLDRYALAEDMKQSIQMMKEQQQKELQIIKEKQEKDAKRLDYKILSDQFRDIQRQIWDIRKEFSNKKMDESNKQTIRNLDMEKDEIKAKMDILRKDAISK
jgi:hypothetical protein